MQMRDRVLTTALASLALLASGPALARGHDAPDPIEEMRLGPVAPAPMGYIEFCQREGADCPMAPGATTPFDKSYWSLAFQQAERSNFGRQKPASMRRFFRSFGSARQQRPPVPAATRVSSQAGDKAIVLSRRVWDEIAQVNAAVNDEIVATPDLAVWKVDDYWSLPVGPRHRRRGDCEDYVLQKRHDLLARGYPQEALSVALVRTRWGEHHAVLIVETTSGAFVLDSLSSHIAPWSALDYLWVVRQNPADPSQWVEIAGQAKNTAPWAPGA